MADSITPQKLKLLLNNCVGFEGDELSKGRKDANDYYFQRARGDEVTGRSQIVTGDVSSMIDATLAQMIRPLLDKRLCEFCCYGEDDVEQSQAESDCVHEMLFKRQNGFIELTAAVKNILMFRYAGVKCYVDTRTYTQTVRRTGVSAMVVPDVLDKIGDTTVHKYDPETGELSATVKKTTRKFRVTAVAPENLLLPKDWNRQDLEDIPYMFERHVTPRSYLIEIGIPKAKVDKLRRYPSRNTTADNRLPRNLSPSGTNTAMAVDTAAENVEWYEGYIKLDDGNGASQLHRVLFGDKVILEDDADVAVIGYAIGISIINPHTFIGVSDYDKLKSTQDTSTALTRGLMDNLNTVTKNRTAHLDGVVEADDLADGRTNGSIRVKSGVVGDVRQAITNFPVDDSTANILANLQYMKTVRAEMGGAVLDLATGSMQLNDRLGSQGLDRAYSVMEQNAEFKMTTVANTLIRNLYVVAHEVLRTEWDGPIQFERASNWVQTTPAQWMARDSVTVNIGKSQNERTRQAAVLAALAQKQESLAQAGMEDILVSATGYYNCTMDWLRINDIPNPERYMLDPRSPGSQNAFKQRALSRQQAAADQKSMMTQAVGLEQLRVALDKYKTDVATQFNYYNAVLNAQIEEAKMSVKGIVDVISAKASAVAAFLRGKTSDSGRQETGSDEPAGESAADGTARSNGKGSNNGLETGADNGSA
jgi:hypothetical protein